MFCDLGFRLSRLFVLGVELRSVRFRIAGFRLKAPCISSKLVFGAHGGSGSFYTSYELSRHG